MEGKYKEAVHERDNEFGQAFARLIIKRIERDEVGRGEKRTLNILREVGACLGRLMREKREGVNEE